jgi:hypothetical protein
MTYYSLDFFVILFVVFGVVDKLGRFAWVIESKNRNCYVCLSLWKFARDRWTTSGFEGETSKSHLAEEVLLDTRRASFPALLDVESQQTC